MGRLTPENAEGKLYVWLHGRHQLAVHEKGEQLTFLRSLVDGHVEHVNPPPEITERVGFVFDIWVNDEFLYREDWEVNDLASRLAGQLVVGPAVISTVDSEGGTHGLTAGQVKALEAVNIFAETSEGYGCEPEVALRVLKSSLN